MSRDLGIYIFSGLMFAVVLFSLWRTFLFFNICMQASVNLHDNMFNSITRATMAFFNTNPSGNLYNKTGVIESQTKAISTRSSFEQIFKRHGSD
jgi:ATP-binding cassette, subfamily C (CFTR/MRP), member 4